MGASSVHELAETAISGSNTIVTTFRDNHESFLPPVDGISLLDVKNELLLSYMQNLAFLVLSKMRQIKNERDGDQNIHEQLVAKLVQLRIYLERGIRPLESRLKYQIDSMLRAAENAQLSQKNTLNGKRRNAAEEGKEADEEDSGDEDSDSALAFADPSSASLHQLPNTNISDLSHGPRLHLTPSASTIKNTSSSSSTTTKSNPSSTSTQVYKPPRHNPTTMPSSDPKPLRAPRSRKSHLLSEYIDEEFSSAPLSQPSIGSSTTVLTRGDRRSGGHLGGSAQASSRHDRERIEYEEMNFKRLPGESKAEKRKRKRSEAREGGGVGRDVFGGEDWTGLGGLGDRISRGVVRKSGEREGVNRRRERRSATGSGRATVDGPRGDGMVGGGSGGIGDVFERRRRVVEGRNERKRLKRR